SYGHGARGKRREGYALDSPIENPDHWISHALLLSSRWNIRVLARSPYRATHVSRVVYGESGVEDFWPLSLYQSFPSGSQGALVLHTVDVHRLDVRDDFFSLRPDAWIGDARAVFFSRGDGHRERGRAHS